MIVSSPQLPASFIIPNQVKCDDYINATNNEYDGIATFDLTQIYNNTLAQLPTPTSDFTIKFYKNQADFNAENDSNGNSLAITNISNYRNIGYPNQQTIWVRVDSNINNGCYGFKTFNVIVEPTPVFNTVGVNNVIPVSYTHLDVYKRQNYWCNFEFIYSSSTRILQNKSYINRMWNRFVFR